MSVILGKVRALRKSKGYSQEELAEKIGVEQKTYSNWERGRTDMTINNLQRIADALGVDVKVFWDPDQFTNPDWQPDSSVQFILQEPREKYGVLKARNLDECMKIVEVLYKKIIQIEYQISELKSK